MITCIVGLPGQGKSLYAVWLINSLAQSGRLVATNIELTPQHPAYEKVIRIGHDDDYPIAEEGRCFFNYLPPGCAIVIDEADIYFDAADHSKLAKQIRIYFKQHRKRKDDVILILQYPANLYVRIRRLVNEWIWCRKDGPTDSSRHGWAWNFVPESWWRFRRTSFADEKMREPIRSAYFTQKEAKILFGWYRTEQLIGATHFE